jgi:hypothetical protein
VAIGVNHAAIGITDRAMQSMVIRGLVVHRGSRYVLTETGRAVFDRARTGGVMDQGCRQNARGSWRLNAAEKTGRTLGMPLGGGRSSPTVDCVAVTCAARPISVATGPHLAKQLAARSRPPGYLAGSGINVAR